MSEIVMKIEAEVEDFTDELSDEALDRAEGAILMSDAMRPCHACSSTSSPVADR